MSTFSLARINRTDLRRLARIAELECADFFRRRPDWKLLYGRRFLGTVLTGRSALHYCNGRAGVEEFELCVLFATHAEAAFPSRPISTSDFGKSKFGRSHENQMYSGRRVRLIGRSLPCRPHDDVVEALYAFMRSGRTPTARRLREDAVVLVSPEPYLGFVAWPTLVT